MTTRTTIRTRPATVAAAKLPALARIGMSLTLALLVMATGAAVAQAAPKRLGVLTFRGPAEGATRNVVTKVAKGKKYQVVGGQAIAKTASKLHVTLTDNDGFQAVAKELGIAAFVVGEVTKKKAMLTVRSGEDGSVSAEASWAGANPRKVSRAVGKTFWRRLGPAIERAKAPSGAKAAVVAEEAPAAETGADEPGDEPSSGDKKKVAAADDASSSDGERSRKSSKKKSGDDVGSETTVSERAEPPESGGGMTGDALIFSVGPRILSRALAYNEDIYRRNSKYNLGVAPEIGLNAEVYPGALAGVSGIAADVGLVVDLSYMLPVVTSPAPNNVGQYKTYSLAWSAGAKVRLPFGLFGTVAYGSQRFQLQPSLTGTAGVDVPMVDYRFVRIGGGGRFSVTPEVSVMANVAYLHCLSLGQIAFANYYPKATCGALEAGGAVGYRISNLIEVQGGASIRRFGLAFHQNIAAFDQATIASDTSKRVAGGAIDQYIMGYVAVAVVLGGSGEGVHKSSSEEAAESDSDESAKKSDDADKSEKSDKDDKDEEESEP